ncbi:uncharacterized protein EAF02_006260 [Botrytis sinoallii]|uniref:uncharacterized protein n=1 Tax=Botrytis sinoallii TaxID=1463999 RepID=UPI001901A527|nr:uncharacterized protein EAF02_006260 [Botrytis sinoallii]KAF7881572.1 hypothetical protein EAF02_006260 [Botrytis sinoallii]
MSTTPSEHIPLSRNHLWGPERRRLSAHLIQKALDALPGSRSSEHLPSKPYKTVKRPYEQHRYTGKASKSYVPPAVMIGGFLGWCLRLIRMKVGALERKFFGQGEYIFFGICRSEVEDEIYKWCLEGRCYISSAGRISCSHVVCTCDRKDSDVGAREEDACIVAGCRGVKILGGSGVHERIGERSGSLIQLLQVCRRINEILPHRFDSITSHNQFFDFALSGSLQIPTSLTHFLLTPSLSQIFLLPFCPHICSFPTSINESSSNDVPRWERTWMIIGSMKSLKSLKATIIWPRKIPAWSHELRLLEPLNMVGILGKDAKDGKGKSKDGERRPENKDGFEVRLRELTKEAKGRGKARAYEVGKDLWLGEFSILIGTRLLTAMVLETRRLYRQRDLMRSPKRTCRSRLLG